MDQPPGSHIKYDHYTVINMYIHDISNNKSVQHCKREEDNLCKSSKCLL